MTKAEELKERTKLTKRYVKDPVLYFEKVLGIETLEQYQKRVIQTIMENDRTAISACHDVGKSFIMARIAIWFLTMHKNSKVITTAPTHRQVEKILWSEIAAAKAKATIPLGGKLNTMDWTINPEWFALGFSPKTEAGGGDGQGTQSSFQGFHAPYVLVVFDEATGIPVNTWTMAEGLLTSAHVKFVAIGNPTSSSSEFARCFKSPAWAKVYLSCFDSPNLIANGITNKEKLVSEIEKVRSMPDADAREYLDTYKVTRPYLLTTKWVVEQARKWGIDHPLTVSKILGKFPQAGDDVLMPLGFIEASQLRVVYPTITDRKTIGADIARFGSDSTILTGLHGPKQLSRKEFYKRRTTEVTGEILNLAREMGGADVIVVDETGLGSGVVDELVEAKSHSETKELLKNTEIRGIQFGASCDDLEDKEKYVNMKARMFGLLSEDLANEKDGLALLPEAVYLDELPTIKKKYNSKGQMVIESKDEYKKNYGRKSPDNADSLALANFGRYDEMKIGTFTKTHTDIKTKPLSGGLNSSRKW